jgi:hypothetical protein
MRYAEFRDLVREELGHYPDGLTWAQLKEALRLPYDRPCPTWVRRMEQEDGLSRAKGGGRAYVWKIRAPGRNQAHSEDVS